MEVPQGKTDQDREQDSFPGDKLQSTKMLKPNNKAEKEEYKQRNFNKTTEYHERHLQIAKEMGDKDEEGRANGNLGTAYHDLGDFHKAIEYHERHLEIAKQVQDNAEEGRAYGNLANAYQGLRDFNKAIEYHERHLEIAKELGDKDEEERAYGSLGFAYHNLGNFQKAIQYHERHLQIAKDVGDKAGETRAYGNLGIAYHELGDFHKAILYHERHLEIAKEAGDKDEEGRAYGNLGITYQRLGDFQKAIEYHERHLKIAKEVGDKDEERRAYRNLGIAYHNLGNFQKAIQYHERHLQVAKEVGDKAGETRAYENLGIAYRRLGDFHKAIQYHERHLEIAKEAGDKDEEERAYRSLGFAYHNVGDFQKAIQHNECHLQIAKDVGDKAGEKRAYRNLGIAYHELGDFHKAIQYHERYLEIAKEAGDKAGETRAYGNLGIAYSRLGDFHKAIQYHERHLEIAKEAGDKDKEVKTYGNLGITYQRLGDFHKAIEYHERHLEIAKEVGDKDEEEQAYRSLGFAYHNLGDFQKAIQYNERHQQIAKEVGDKAGEKRAYGNLGIAYHELGDFHKAILYHKRHLEIAKEAGDKDKEERAHRYLGFACNNLGDYQKAIKYNERHLEIAKESGDKDKEGRAYGNLGITYQRLGDFHKAIEYHKRHLKIAKEVGDRDEEGQANENLGIAYHNLGNFQKAIQYHERHLQIAKENVDKAGETWAYENLGIAYQRSGDFQKAIEYHERHLEIAKEVGDKYEEGRAYGNLGIAYHILGNFQKAIQYHEHHLQIAKEVGDKAGETWAYESLGIAYHNFGNFQKAIQYHERHLQIAKEVGDKAEETRAYENLGIAYDNLGDFQKTIQYHERRLEIAKEAGDKDEEGRAYGNLGIAYHDLGDFHKAIEYQECHPKIAKEVGNEAGEGGTYAIEEDEVPYYTGRKKLADEKDATVDYEENKTLIKRGKIGGKEDTWHLREAGASIKLCSGAVQQPVPFTCRCLLWNPRTLSPPIASDEILVSSVIEISHDGPPDLDYRKSFKGISFTVSLLQSAPYLEGYEVVIKQLTDQENNEWKELKTENTWHGSETSTVPKWLFPFAQAVCTKSAVSSFAAVWRPKSFTFSRGTARGPELTCIVPDLPDVSVQIPQSCVPVYQDFCVTIKVQEFPSSELKGEEGLVGPVLYISGSQNVSLIAPVTIRIPLTFRKGKEELAELRPGELRILQCEAHYWKDITDKLDEPPRLVDGKVQFKVRHFSGFRPIKLMRSLLQSTSGFTEFVGKLCKRSRPQHARFFTCLCETGVRGHFKLKLFCYPQRLYYDVIRKISECVVLYKDEGCSSIPVCGEEKILVSLSEAMIPQGTDQKNALQFVRFRENEVFYTGGEVCLGSEGVPGVKFSDQSQELLCNMIMVLASQVSDPVTFDYEERSAPEEEKSLEVEEFSSRSTDQDVRQKEEAARNVDERKTVIKRGKIADESETWNLAKAGASITFNLGAITKSLTITCSLWTPAALSPPIGSNELLVSNVIELSHDGPPDLEFMENASGSINVALLHSASNSKGYEVVIKQLVDPEYNEWEDLETKNIWHSSVHPTIPNWTCPSAKASCSKRWFSSFAAVWRLKSFVFPKPTSKTSEFICSLPDYPNVSVAIPWNSLPVDTDFSLTLKVQEAPTIDHNVEGMLVGPILHISCSNNVKLSVPAKISLPLSLTDGEIELAELHSGQVKILHFNSREESQEWTDITDHLDMPVVLRDGIVTFQVKTFCRFWPWLLKTFISTPWKYATLLYDGIMKRHAGFLACLCSDAVPARYVLNMFCFPQHLRSKVSSDISSAYFVNMQGEGTSQKPLSSGDETCVSLSSGFEVQGARNVEDIVLKFLGSEHFLESLRVSIKDPSDLQVDFLKLLGDKERKNSPILCQVPIIPRSSVQLSVPITFDFEGGSGISAQSVRPSIVEQPNSESSLCSPVAASDKRKRYSVKAYGPSDDELGDLSLELGEKWGELGRQLGFNQAAIDNFDLTKRELADKASKMLMTWRQKEGSNATYKVLYDALCNKKVQCKLLAEQFCCNETVGNASA